MIPAEPKSAGIQPPSKLQQYKGNKRIKHKASNPTAFYCLVPLTLRGNWGISCVQQTSSSCTNTSVQNFFL